MTTNKEIMNKYNIKYLGELPNETHYLIDYITDDETLKKDFKEHFDCNRIVYIQHTTTKPNQLILHRYYDSEYDDWIGQFFTVETIKEELEQIKNNLKEFEDNFNKLTNI